MDLHKHLPIRDFRLNYSAAFRQPSFSNAHTVPYVSTELSRQRAERLVLRPVAEGSSQKKDKAGNTFRRTEAILARVKKRRQIESKNRQQKHHSEKRILVTGGTSSRLSAIQGPALVSVRSCIGQGVELVRRNATHRAAAACGAAAPPRVPPPPNGATSLGATAPRGECLCRRLCLGAAAPRRGTARRRRAAPPIHLRP